jgi:hypothetical protein
MVFHVVIFFFLTYIYYVEVLRTVKNFDPVDVHLLFKHLDYTDLPMTLHVL